MALVPATDGEELGRNQVLGVLVLIACVILGTTGCAVSSPTPMNTSTPMPSATADSLATEEAIAARIFATLTASAPTVTDTPSKTPSPSPTLTPTETVTPVPATDTPTPRPEPTATWTPEPPTPTKVPELVVEWRKLHYECQGGRVWQWGLGTDLTYSGYRSFQVEVGIINNSTRAVEPYWGVTRWLITDGVNTREDTKVWEWYGPRREKYDQPVILPGASATWTEMCYPLNQGEWVSAAEFDWGGHTYRGEFDLGPYGDAHNYVNCP